ncbi:MAG: hypothetical protein ACREQQ_11350 [Candidatus Binatia bacterium]
MIPRILLALVLLFQSLPAWVTAAPPCPGASVAQHHCPFHAQASPGDHCVRKRAHHDCHGRSGAAKTAAIGSASCPCQHGSDVGAVARDPFLKRVLATAEARAVPRATVVTARSFVLEIESTPPTPPPRLVPA